MSQSGYHYVVTLIAPDDTPLEGELLDAAIAALAPKQWKWLRRRKAIDCLFTGAPADVQLNAVRELGDLDMFFQSTEGREKKLLICDMDSTIIQQECVDELADMLGKKAEVAAITEKAMNGELDFKDSLRERVSLLEGLPESELQRCYEERVTLSPGAKKLVQGMRQSGAHTLLVSGGFVFFTGRVGKDAGFQEHYANKLEVVGGKLTGRVLDPILDKDAKEMILTKKMQQLGLEPHQVIAVGDGANDLPMLEKAGLGVAYKAKPVVQEAAKYRLNHNSLDVLLWVAGLENRPD